jgi:hypothetical protein
MSLMSEVKSFSAIFVKSEDGLGAVGIDFAVELVGLSSSLFSLALPTDLFLFLLSLALYDRELSDMTSSL